VNAALVVSFWIFAGAWAGTWLLSMVTREYSWVDRIWSVIPIAYVAVFAAAADFGDARLNTMLALVVAWGARLTFNFARKGGYAPGGEDYRWDILRGRMSRWQFQLFNLFFISFYQNVILLLICLPAYTALTNPRPFGVWDIVAAVAFVGLLVGETIADQQQWNFQQWKRAEVSAGRDSRPRFLQTGLFRFSRHPNFFFEQAQWWVVFFFGVIAAGSLWQPSVAGAVLLNLLFVGSTRFTESISVSRYPEYAQYQATTSAVIPWPPARRSRGGKTAIASPPDGTPERPEPRG
jgi:steroid 5-alpha reductase family enzyme